ncbi:hypothetical protein CDL12_11129 [Handroanthus impetiginosus]|uniref:F-box domain-containing protein n=1 Tax=Handroanthus impetiginosus TaxID=429701 RepID=A0A2G9HFE1_9LAMI|nr:hypothetical protein CDL12_11129 [Handroanthus impetiginosus]
MCQYVHNSAVAPRFSLKKFEISINCELKGMDHQDDETRIDFLQHLETDISLYIMSFLDDPADLVSVSAVSWFWRQFVIGNGLVKQLCLRKYPHLSSIVGMVNPNDGTVKTTENNNTVEWETLERNQTVYASLLQALTESEVSPKDCIANAVSASSTDRYLDESIVNTLNPSEASYWSSEGRSNPEIPETLIYILRAGISVITEIDIQPFEAFFERGKPIYSAKFVRFRVGHPNSLSDIGDYLQMLPLQEPADYDFVWTYTSPEFPMVQENRLQPFKLPEPVLCIGGYLQIELLGRVQTQETDGLFYICVCYVRVLGRTFFPAFDRDPRARWKAVAKVLPRESQLHSAKLVER